MVQLVKRMFRTMISSSHKKAFPPGNARGYIPGKGCEREKADSGYLWIPNRARHNEMFEWVVDPWFIGNLGK